MLDQIQQLGAQATGELAQAGDAAALEAWRLKYLSKSGGQITAMLRGLGKLPAEQRPAVGQAANLMRAELEAAFESRKAQLDATGPRVSGPMPDVTLPGSGRRLGSEHLISQTITELSEIFGRMGFDIATGPEVEDEFHNFVALNIPAAHPARDPLDNFYLDPTRLLRSQTSTIQIRVMEKQRPPLRVIAIGRVYRPDAIDARHHVMFHQIEGLYVGENVTMVDLKSCLNQFVHAYYGPQVQTRFRPSFFPFTEPSAELDISWFAGEGGEGGKGSQGSPKWVELGGCGMVDPAVFEAVGYDPEQYTGFAFGLGVERILMRKFRLPDIRLLLEGDVRFLSQW